MAVKASPEIIREMERDINNTIRDVTAISEGIRRGISGSAGWDDPKALEFASVMQEIARLTESPVNTLTAAVPKLEKLAQALDKYNSVHIR